MTGIEVTSHRGLDFIHYYSKNKMPMLSLIHYYWKNKMPMLSLIYVYIYHL